ncbi:MAG: hypothetical protein ACR2M2_05320 [Gaiellaceae bacterium]
MAERNLLVVLLEDRFRPRLRQAIAERNDETARVHVVAPARVGPLEWFATDEDEARAAAAARVLEVERLLADEVEVESEVGDAGPVLASRMRFAASRPTRSCSWEELPRMEVWKPRFEASACR